MGKTALICGVSGQDGALLASLLLKKGYRVIGTSRDAQVSSFNNLERLGIKDKVELKSVALNDFRSVLQCLKSVEPKEIYNLAGQSSVGLSFEQPVETLESIAIGTLNWLEAIRFSGAQARFYNACSSECFGETIGPASEDTPFRPRSPYAVAKATAFWEVANYREAYKIHSCSGILFNHESPLRPDRFVTKKIVKAVNAICSGHNVRLRLGRTSISRDWGWAPDYVEGMHRMLQTDEPGDFVLATGESHTLQEFLETAFRLAGLNWEDHVDVDETLFRPLDISTSIGDASKAEKILGWRAKVRFEEIVRRMLEAENGAANELDLI